MMLSSCTRQTASEQDPQLMREVFATIARLEGTGSDQKICIDQNLMPQTHLQSWPDHAFSKDVLIDPDVVEALGGTNTQATARSYEANVDSEWLAENQVLANRFSAWLNLCEVLSISQPTYVGQFAFVQIDVTCMWNAQCSTGRASFYALVRDGSKWNLVSTVQYGTPFG
jgi:hypothetical protein